MGYNSDALPSVGKYLGERGVTLRLALKDMGCRLFGWS
jgi:hypothetical protein